MSKEWYHPNAYLREIRNIKRGLKARTLIIEILERSPVDTKTIASTANMNYSAVFHHLKLLKRASIARNKNVRKPYVWELTGMGQKQLATSA